MTSFIFLRFRILAHISVFLILAIILAIFCWLDFGVILIIETSFFYSFSI